MGELDDRTEKAKGKVKNAVEDVKDAFKGDK